MDRNGTIADVAVVWAKVDGEAGVDPESADAIRGFLVGRELLASARG